MDSNAGPLRPNGVTLIVSRAFRILPLTAPAVQPQPSNSSQFRNRSAILAPFLRGITHDARDPCSTATGYCQLILAFSLAETLWCSYCSIKQEGIGKPIVASRWASASWAKSWDRPRVRAHITTLWCYGVGAYQPRAGPGSQPKCLPAFQPAYAGSIISFDYSMGATVLFTQSLPGYISPFLVPQGPPGRLKYRIAY